MVSKNCCYKGCKNDSRYSSREYMQGIFFLTFPKSTANLEKCQRWISACARPEFLTLESLKKNRYICSFHFIGGAGPTDKFPDPVPYHEYCVDDTHTTCETSLEISEAPVEVVLSTENCSTSTDERSLSVEKPISSLSHEKPSLSTNEQTSSLNIINRKLIVEKPRSITDDQWLNLNPNSPILTLQNSKSNQIDKRKQVLFSDITDTTDLLKKFIEYQFFADIQELTWTISRNDDSTLRIFKVNCTHICAIEVRINLKLEFEILVYGILIDGNRSLFEAFPKKISSLSDLLKLLLYISSLELCNGTGLSSESKFNEKLGCRNLYTKTLFSQKCSGLIMNGTRRNCKNCQCFKSSHLRNQKRAKLKFANLKVSGLKRRSKNIGSMTREELVALLTTNKTKTRVLKRQTLRLKQKIQALKQSLSEEPDFLLAEPADEDSSCTKENFLRLLFQEQFKLLKNKKIKPQKWHPAIIKWCYYLRAKSPSAYETLREVLPLPARRTLFKYASELSGQSCFAVESITEMRGADEQQKYFSLVVDEMKSAEVAEFCPSSDSGNMLKEAENEKIHDNISEDFILPVAESIDK